MATAFRRLFVNKETKTLQVSDTNGGPFILPYFNKYETIPLSVVIVEPDYTAVGINRFGRVDISPLSLKVAIHSGYDTASPLTEQTTWTKDETLNTFEGELPMNVAAMNTFIGSSATIAAVFEIEWSEGTARSKIVLPCILQNAVTQPGSAGPAATTEYYTKPETNAQFVAKIMPAGEQITITSPGNVYQRIIGVDDGGNVIDQVVPV